MGQVSSHGIAPAIYKNLMYDPLEDFQPITLLLTIPNVMVVRKDHPAKTVEEFINLARSSVHLSGEMFKTRTGLEMTHVPFRGSSEAIPSLIAGDIDVIFDNLPASMPHIQSGTLRALAVTTLQRSESLPDIPTLAEIGIKPLEGFSAESWFGLLAPKKVDGEIVSKLSQALNAILSSSDFKAFALLRGGSVQANTPDEFKSFIESELVKWKSVVEEAGISIN
jgi:tripartite-type tricarboxylate transporter receptor subunit TctC